MKRKLPIVYSLFLVCAAVLWMSSSGGRATAAGQGNTGAPGDAGSTCITCHGGDNITVETVLTILDDMGDPITEYMPGETYRARLEVQYIDGNEPSAYGFQMVALADMDDSDIAGFDNPDANTTVAVAVATGRQYAEHAGPNRETGLFEVDWTAPELGTGSVTFYAGGNGVNLNGSTGGDGADLTTVQLTESSSSSTNVALADLIQLGPNPIRSQLSIQADQSLSEYQIHIFDHIGQSVYRSTLSRSQIDASTWRAGLYLAQITDPAGKAQHVQKLLKK